MRVEHYCQQWSNDCQPEIRTPIGPLHMQRVKRDREGPCGPPGTSLARRAARANGQMGCATASPELFAEKRHHPLAGLVRGVPVDLAYLIGEHGVRRPRETTGIAWRGIDLDDLEGITESLLQRHEPI